MILTAQIRFKDVLKYLDVESIPGCDDAPEDWIEFTDCVDIDEWDIPECDLCGGEGRAEPEDSAVNDWLLKDFLAAIRTGDIRTAQCLVGRVFELSDDIGAADRSLCKCPSPDGRRMAETGNAGSGSADQHVPGSNPNRGQEGA